MMRAFMMVLLVGVFGAVPLASQQGRQDPERMREMVVQRFMENFRSQAGLTEEQFGRLQQSLGRTFQRRQELQHREQEVLQALQGQLRPGVAACCWNR
jgi:hypothetical protein